MVITPQIFSSQNYSQPFCTPNNKTILYSNTYNLVTWEVSNTLYFYYRKNYQFIKTVNFTNIGINQGFNSLYVNNDFFHLIVLKVLKILIIRCYC